MSASNRSALSRATVRSCRSIREIASDAWVTRARIAATSSSATASGDSTMSTPRTASATLTRVSKTWPGRKLASPVEPAGAVSVAGARNMR